MNSLDPYRRELGVTFHERHAEILVWAPFAESLQLRIYDKEDLAFHQEDRGYWRLLTGRLKPGDAYKLLINCEKEFPDPCSLSQPEGVHNFSRAVDVSDFNWTDQRWQNIPQHDLIMYELHIGTFTKDGTFDAALEKLAHLRSLGVNAIEIMPVASFPGTRNWGYDGVYPFAVQESYGGYRGLQNFVNQCHKEGFAVVLDAVYNHMGPEGNYLEQFGPYFTEKYKTPWGKAINFDDDHCDEVRRFFIENALMWFRDFHIDALRLDAVHAIRDFSASPFLKELKHESLRLSEHLGKPCYLIAECDLNDPKFIDLPQKNGYGLDAQWTDEFHHSLRVSAGQKRIGYYADFNGVSDLARAYAHAYVYNGQYSEQRHRSFGAPVDVFKGDRFVVFSQNHDQTGNRLLGERTSSLVSFEMLKIMATAVMVSPYLPLLFMGEEWGETNPFLYFADHSDPGLIDAVREGRKREFKDLHQDGDPIDPFAPETYERCMLQWDLAKKEPNNTLLTFYTNLIRLRKHHFNPQTFPRKNLTAVPDVARNILMLERWNQNQRLICILNFSAREQPVSLPPSLRKDVLMYTAEKKWGGPCKGIDSIPEGEFPLVAESALICLANV